MSDKRLIVVVGPTGSGKTDLSIRLALNYDAPILSTDSARPSLRTNSCRQLSIILLHPMT